MPYSPPKTIQSPQNGPYLHLNRVVNKHLSTRYRRPYRQHNREVFDLIQAIVASDKWGGLILDSCCGTGLSTQLIAERNPTCLVIGIDQSRDRLTRQSDRFSARATNSVLYQANCEDIWRLCVEHGIQFDQHFILYPNPYPKSEHFKRRWHGHPCFPYLAKLSGITELRSNWGLYLDEFAMAWEIMTGNSFVREELVAKTPLTLFEKKYTDSGQSVYRLIVR